MLLLTFLFLFSSFFSTVLYTTCLLQQKAMVIKLTCKICNKAVANNQHAAQCGKCHIWVRINVIKKICKLINFYKKSHLAGCCINCFEDIVPFGTISKKEHFKTNQRSKIKLLSSQIAMLHLVMVVQKYINRNN